MIRPARDQLGTLAAGPLAWHWLVPTYRAASLIRVDPEVQDLVNVQPKAENIDVFLMTQVQLITSPNVLRAASTAPNVVPLARLWKPSDPVREVRDHLAVFVIPQTYLIEVAATSTDPREAPSVVNAVVEAYTEASAEWTDGTSRVKTRNLETYSQDLRNQTDELERKWKELAARGDLDRKAKQAGLISPDHGAKIEEKLIELDLDRMEAQA